MRAAWGILGQGARIKGQGRQVEFKPTASTFRPCSLSLAPCPLVIVAPPLRGGRDFKSFAVFCNGSSGYFYALLGKFCRDLFVRERFARVFGRQQIFYNFLHTQRRIEENFATDDFAVGQLRVFARNRAAHRGFVQAQMVRHAQTRQTV